MNIDQFIEYLILDDFNIEYIPQTVSISVIILSCSLGTSLEKDNISHYLPLDKNNIVFIKSKDTTRLSEDLPHLEYKSMNINKIKKFDNASTIIMNVEKDIYVNIKLFDNGTLHISGCKHFKYINCFLNKLINILKKELYIEDKNKFIKFIKKDICFCNFKIHLINCNFTMKYKINIIKLFNCLLDDKIYCRIPITHSSVNIDYTTNDNHKVSIFVFQTGNIILTGSRKTLHIRESYYYIVNYLNKYKKIIIKRDLKSILNTKECIDILSEYI